MSSVETHICGETGGHQSGGCGCEVEMDDTIVIGNTSFCVPCAERIEEEKILEEEHEWVADEWQHHLGFRDEIPTPSNFKYPERCGVVWNVKAQKKEWRQYVGAGYTCVPEKNSLETKNNISATIS